MAFKPGRVVSKLGGEASAASGSRAPVGLGVARSARACVDVRRVATGREPLTI